MKKKGYFDLFGFDFMVSTSPTRSSRLLLLEVNTNPALSLGTNFHYTLFILLFMDGLIIAKEILKTRNYFSFVRTCVCADNTTLTNLLPGVVDGTVELVLKTQGPEGKCDSIVSVSVIL